MEVFIQYENAQVALHLQLFILLIIADEVGLLAKEIYEVEFGDSFLSQVQIIQYAIGKRLNKHAVKKGEKGVVRPVYQFFCGFRL